MKNTKTYATFALVTLLSVGGYNLLDGDALEMTTYTVQAGNHFSFPRIFKLKRNPEEVRWDVKFNSNCDYKILNEDGSIHHDQRDWNKLCGVFFSLFNTRKDSAMMGWRYNEKNDEIEMAPYYHVNASRDMFPTMMTVKREEPFTLRLRIDLDNKKYIWLMEKEDFKAKHEMDFGHGGGFCGIINFYFGGNQVAPQEVSCEMGMEVR